MEVAYTAVTDRTLYDGRLTCTCTWRRNWKESESGRIFLFLFISHTNSLIIVWDHHFPCKFVPVYFTGFPI